MPNLKHLYYFYIFSQELSTTKAAKRLRISSAALSNQLKQLSIFLGFSLTRRTNGKVVITETGEMVLHYAERMFSAYDELRTQITVINNPDTILFRVGICQNLSARFSFDLLSLIVNSSLSFAPKVSVIYHSSLSLLAGFKKGQFDLVLGAFPLESMDKKQWISQNLAFPVRLFAPQRLLEGIAAKERHAMQSDPGRFIEIANAKKISLVLPSQPSALRDETERFLCNSRVRPARTIESNSASAIVQLIERGFAMGFVPTPCLLDFKSADSLSVLGTTSGYWNHGVTVFMRKGEARSMTKISPLAEMFSEAFEE